MPSKGKGKVNTVKMDPRKTRVPVTEHPLPDHGPTNLGRLILDLQRPTHKAPTPDNDSDHDGTHVSDRVREALKTLLVKAPGGRGKAFREEWCCHLQGLAKVVSIQVRGYMRQAAQAHLDRLLAKPQVKMEAAIQTSPPPAKSMRAAAYRISTAGTQTSDSNLSSPENGDTGG
ncbi:hypothetical protein EV426DRAFT_707426 [Tirmania nivea]|nr:hypothetical protein EV426DRAFT_707426 [Tirmania nivea]